MIVGPTLSEISATYLCINENIRFETSSCSAAIELCMKIVKTMSKKHSHVASHVWEVIEIAFFGFTNEHPSSAVNSVVKKIIPVEPQPNVNI